MAEQRRRGRARGQGRTEGEAEASPRTPATVRCPYCHDDVHQDAIAARCAACQTVHHASCFDERGGCSVDGCSGKAAHVVKGWRAALGPCRACKLNVYLDENVALCGACEAIHHPGCLEAHAGCAECSSGEGLIVRAGAYRSATLRWHRIARVAGAGVIASLAGMVVAPLVLVKLLGVPGPGGLAAVLGFALVALFLRALEKALAANAHARAIRSSRPEPVRPSAAAPKPDEPAPPGGPSS